MAWSEDDIVAVTQALAVVCEVTGTGMSDPAKRFVLRELESHPAQDVLRGLERSSKECKGRLTLADIVKAIEFVDRKALSDARAARSAYLTKLRGCALVERIPWNEVNPESVREQLEAKGYRFGTTGTTSKPIRSLPHWTENDEA